MDSVEGSHVPLTVGECSPLYFMTQSCMLWAGTDSQFSESGSGQAGRTIDCVHHLSQRRIMFIQMENVCRIKEPRRTCKDPYVSDPCPECRAECT